MKFRDAAIIGLAALLLPYGAARAQEPAAADEQAQQEQEDKWDFGLRFDLAPHNQGTLYDVLAIARTPGDFDVQALLRYRVTIPYEKNEDGEVVPNVIANNELSVGYVDLAGIRLLGQAFLAGGKITPKAGVLYAGKVGDFKALAKLTVSLQDNPFGELFTLMSYSFEGFGDDDRIVIEYEGVHWANQKLSPKERSPFLGTSRLRVGWQGFDGHFMVGPFGEVDYGVGKDPDGRGGVVVRLSGSSN